MEKRPSIFVIQPIEPRFEPVYAIIREAASAVRGEVFRADDITQPGKIIEQVYSAIEAADVLIVDVSFANPNVLYELGIAHAQQKPCILITQDAERLPFDISTVRTIVYDLTTSSGPRVLRLKLGEALASALKSPKAFSDPPTTDTAKHFVFISYSHHDEMYLRRLLVHLRPLEKNDSIDLWVDTKLEAGDKWNAEIETALARARVAILLVSADFLASDFIVDNELPPLLESAASRGTRIIPVIVSHCRFSRDENLKGFQAINDPRNPIASLDENGREEIYNEVAVAVEQSLRRGP